MHLNWFCLIVISKAFLDVVIQPGQQPDEREALHSMLDHSHPTIRKIYYKLQTAVTNPMISCSTVSSKTWVTFSV